MTAATLFFKANCKLSLVRKSSYRVTSTDSNSLDNVGDNVMPRYISSFEASPCLYFNSGFIIPFCKAVGTKACLTKELNNKQI